VETLAKRIVKAARQYALEHPGATWESVADAMDVKLDAESAAWFWAHPELTLAALSGE
jgi:hypothetical protein